MAEWQAVDFSRDRVKYSAQFLRSCIDWRRIFWMESVKLEQHGKRNLY